MKISTFALNQLEINNAGIVASALELDNITDKICSEIRLAIEAFGKEVFALHSDVKHIGYIRDYSGPRAHVMFKDNFHDEEAHRTIHKKLSSVPNFDLFVKSSKKTLFTRNYAWLTEEQAWQAGWVNFFKKSE